jgi:hypothetical protein
MRRIFQPMCTYRMACRMRGGHGARRGRFRIDRAVVECILDHDVSLLVWRGGLPADALWQLCCRVVLVLAVVCGVAGGAIVFSS